MGSNVYGWWMAQTVKILSSFLPAKNDSIRNSKGCRCATQKNHLWLREILFGFTVSSLLKAGVIFLFFSINWNVCWIAQRWLGRTKKMLMKPARVISLLRRLDMRLSAVSETFQYFVKQFSARSFTSCDLFWLCCTHSLSLHKVRAAPILFKLIHLDKYSEIKFTDFMGSLLFKTYKQRSKSHM